MWNKHWLAVFGTLLLAGAIVTARMAALSRPEPGLEPSETVHDFGPVRQGTTVKASFRLTNNGRTDVAINGVFPDCSCTA